MSENHFSFGDFYSCRNANTEVNNCRKQNKESTYWHVTLTSFPFIDLFYLPPTYILPQRFISAFFLFAVWFNDKIHVADHMCL